MAPLEYWLMRSIRRSLPKGLIDFIHDRGIFRTPGIETRKPGSAAEWYAEQAQSRGRTLEAKTVCVVGFGGSYGVGVYLLELGVRRVILQDPFAALRHARNATLPKALRDKYFTVQGDDWRPDPARLLVLRDHLAPYAAKHAQSADFVVSRAVFEHVEDVEALVQACSLLTKPGGMNFHLVDLRDHYFKYPFEMLCYAEPTWQRWLNASNNLNRFRVPDYRAAFDGSFTKVDIEIRDRLREEFRRTQSRIRKEFLTGDEDIDAAVKILITAVR